VDILFFYLARGSFYVATHKSVNYQNVSIAGHVGCCM